MNGYNRGRLTGIELGNDQASAHGGPITFAVDNKGHILSRE
ncbi:hypothetical protein STIAU_6455 [Stigmatella aurantiaca DW4/3-1]|uniref:Uncharacterized protein n=1 Tax=Stigmatella aurantiaca (strain DW4/3-1) TaxID=378806 RepID=Q08RP0_STIAD|nr:hypothetical protein STIAU_6455 [Stigmatella aurantiaca DW4/3-1]